MNKNEKLQNRLIKLLKSSFLIAILIFSIIDLILKLCNCPLKYYEDNDAQMLLVLLPFVITIVSISLTLTSDKIENISMFEFRKLRSKFYFSFREMMIITLLLFTFYFASIHLKLYISTLLIEISSIIYSFIFAMQELPLLERSKKYILKVIKKYFSSQTNGTFDKSKINFFKNSDLKIVLTSFLFNHGLKNAYFDLKVNDFHSNKNKNILDTLMSLNNISLMDSISCSKTSLASKDDSYFIDISKVIEKSFSNIKEVLSFENDFDLTIIYDDKEFQSYNYVVDIILKLKNLCNFYNFIDLFNNEFDILFISFNSELKDKKDEKYKVYKNKVINKIILRTVLYKDYWFASSLLNFQKKNSMFKDEIFYLIFYMSILFKCNLKGEFLLIENYGFNAKKVTDDDKLFKEFLSVLLKTFLEDYSIITIFSYIPKIAEYFRYEYNEEQYFEIIKDIFSCILGCIFYLDYKNDCSKDDIEKYINQLNKEDKKLFSEVLKEKWIKNGRFCYGKGYKSYCSYYNINKKPQVNEPNDDLIEIFKELISENKL